MTLLDNTVLNPENMLGEYIANHAHKMLTILAWLVIIS